LRVRTTRWFAADVTKELGQRSLEAIEAGNLAEFGRLLHVHWSTRRSARR
jgi:hypothetical protein